MGSVTSCGLYHILICPFSAPPHLLLCPLEFTIGDQQKSPYPDSFSWTGPWLLLRTLLTLTLEPWLISLPLPLRCWAWRWAAGLLGLLAAYRPFLHASSSNLFTLKGLLHSTSTLFLKNNFIYLQTFNWLGRVLVVACGIFSLHCGMWDLEVAVCKLLAVACEFFSCGR